MIIKKSPVDNNLAKCVARLKLANNNLKEKLRGRDFPQIHLGIRLVKSSINFFQEASKASEAIPGNSALSTYGVALSCEGENLCKDASEGLRLFFEVIPGGKNEQAQVGP